MSTPSNEPTRDLEDGLDSPARQPRSSVPSFLFISFVLFMLMSGRGDEYASTRDIYVNGLQSLKHQLSNYTAWLNGTESNFTLPSQDPNTTPLVAAFISTGQEVDPKHESYYSNMTGFWHGDLQAHNLTALNATEQMSPWRHLSEQFILPTNLSAIPELLGTWNWTRSNKLTLNVGDKLVLLNESQSSQGKNIAIIHGKLDLADPKSSDEMRLDFEGIHILSTGSVYAYAECTGHGIDIRHLPALVPDAYRNESAHAVESEMKVRITKLQEKINSGVFEEPSSADDNPKTKCSFKLFAQLDRSGVTKEQMDELESELDEPTGISTASANELALEGVLLSQDCGILYEIKHAVGVQTRKLYGKITTYSGFATLVNFFLLVLFRRQAAQSSSAAGLSRVSRYTFLVQSLIDSVSFVGHVTIAIIADGRSSLSALAPAGLACLLFVYEAQFAILIGLIQAPEDAPSPQPATTAPPAPAAPAEGPAPGTLPLPAQAAPSASAPAAAPTPTPAQERPTFLRFLWTHIRTDPAARIWLTMSLCLIFVSRIVIALSLPVLFLAALHSFMWSSQVYRSTRRARSSGLSAEYLVGTTLGRLFFAGYFLGCPKNIFDIEPRRWLYVVGLLMLAQVLVILLQEHVDPAFFLPQRVAPAQSYDYHPPLPLPDAEAPDQSLGDCAICMDAIVVDPSLRHPRADAGGPEKAGAGGSGIGVGFGMRIGMPMGVGRTGLFGRAVGGGRKTYSLAPCHHLFHTECLERWLAIKNICPQCRRALPPL